MDTLIYCTLLLHLWYIQHSYYAGKLPIEVNTDEVPHGLISESILPPPLPPKLSENDAPPVPPKMIEMINEDRVHQVPPLPPKIKESSFITSQPTSVPLQYNCMTETKINNNNIIIIIMSFHIVSLSVISRYNHPFTC